MKCMNCCGLECIEIKISSLFCTLRLVEMHELLEILTGQVVVGARYMLPIFFRLRASHKLRRTHFLLLLLGRPA
ncbi:hypothetical protein PRUPE_1G203600 [Prunus persica]|uniref:Uncharacterized protein n=1 Tax=Prunus persica TaxID=3760 RepID=A0A251R0T0_PRUPE|nr:hypothetical protein PRUPE_1G203600 [Prunus persica]ONI29592.1 hypothetical protein PRUPE_1G203600 [Prunus persica]ONI29593.1 hypothetical protein PRUPE_1G203600 [Prunus persica]